ncbi:MAG: methylglyoxal synthase [Bacteroidales bacterium]|nr:methylglyoxal synthase [Bacteroidales bacterium]MCF8334019.1 methylglyoxal synthase [Bacteroidales bacterium]
MAKEKKKSIALVAHNAKKHKLLEWAKENKASLADYHIIGTSNTSALLNNVLDLGVKPFGHGPNGGDILLAAKILQGEVDGIVFFIDVENPHGHEHDIQTLIRTAVLNNVPIALNQKTADYLVSEAEM